MKKTTHADSPHVFISYAHRDETFKDELVHHLDVLVNSRRISVWQDRQIDAGDDWRAEIGREIETCDIALLMVSQYFLRSKFINSVELSRLLEREKEGLVRIIPIIVRPCLWGSHPMIRQRNAMPTDGRAVISFAKDNGERDQIWKEIAERLTDAEERSESINMVNVLDVPTIKHNSSPPEARFPDRYSGGIVTMMFCGYRAAKFSASLEVHAVEKQTTTYRSVIEKELNRRGLFVRAIPDATFAAFHNASDAVSAALTIQRLIVIEQTGNADLPTIDMRMGLHIGEVSRDEIETVQGFHPSIAYHLMLTADPGQILTSTTVHDSTAFSSFDVPREHVSWASHGDYLLSNGTLREILEVSDRRIRKPAPPAASGERSLLSNARKIEFSGIRLIEQVGHGALSAVYRAIDTSGDNNQEVAVKVMIAESELPIRESFIASADAVRQINNPGIINIIKIEKDSEPPYVVMEWIEGVTLKEACEKLDFGQISDLLIRVCDAIQCAHENGVIHRDLKPTNVLVRTGDSTPIIVDFEFATDDFDAIKRTQSQSSLGTVGTPLYIAPEQIAGKSSASELTDIYALGIMIYELFVGNPPFCDRSIQNTFEAHLNEDPELPMLAKPECPEPIQRICLKAIEKQPEYRYQSVAQLRRDLNRWQLGEPVTVRPRMYNNVIETRARSHLEAITTWFKRGLITEKENVELSRTYSSLVRSGLQAVSESRLLHMPIVLMYLAGVLFLTGTIVLLSRHAQTLGEEAWIIRSLIGSSPAILAGVLWRTMIRLGRYRAAFVLSLLAIIAMPFAFANLFFEVTNQFFGESNAIAYHGTEYAYFNGDSGGLHKYFNWQVTLALAISLTWAEVVAKRTGTFTVGGMCAGLTALLYIVGLDHIGIRWLTENFAWLGVWLVPLSALAFVYGLKIRSKLPRVKQSVPFFFVALVALIIGSQLIAFNGPNKFYFEPRVEKLNIPLESLQSELQAASATGKHEIQQRIEILQRERDYNKSSTLRHYVMGLVVFFTGALYFLVGVVLRRNYPVEAVAAYRILFMFGIVIGVFGLFRADSEWISAANHPDMYADLIAWGFNVGPNGLSLVICGALVGAMVVVASAVFIQSYATMIIGLAATTLTIWQIDSNLQESGRLWSIAVSIIGLVCVLALALFVRKPKESDDFDDVGEKLIKLKRNSSSAG